jgi:hypothetical protein
VLRLLITEGGPPDHLPATGFGEHHPLDAGDTQEAFAKNWRIELPLTDYHRTRGSGAQDGNLPGDRRRHGDSPFGLLKRSSQAVSTPDACTFRVIVPSRVFRYGPTLGTVQQRVGWQV